MSKEKHIKWNTLKNFPNYTDALIEIERLNDKISSLEQEISNLSSEDSDICEDLRNFAYIADSSVGLASLVMLDGSIFSEAADEIESLRLKLKSLNEIE
jgi:hypothetical protein